MKNKLAVTLSTFAILFFGLKGIAQSSKSPDSRIVRIAEIEIDPARVNEYNAALQKAVQAAQRLEPGVLALNAVFIKGHPEEIRVFEVYANFAAYQSHLQTPHFKLYKEHTKNMVRSLKLLETDNIVLASKELSAQ